MASRTQQLAQSAGLSTHEGVACGRLNGIFLNASINNYNGMVSVIAFIKRDTGFDITEAESFFAQNKDKYRNVKISYNGSALSVSMPNYLKLNVKIVSELLTELTFFLYNHGYRSACAFCENTNGLSLIAKNGVVMEACPECQNKLEGASNELAQQRAETGSYGKGAIGAILGGIIGIIPWVIINSLGYIAAISGLIMAYLSFKGYQLMKGRRGKGMIYIIIAVLIVFTYVAIIINQTIDIYNAYPGDKSDLPVLGLFGAQFIAPFANSTLYFGDYYLTPDSGAMWGQIALGWFFAALGSVFYLRRVGRIGSGKDIAVKRISQSENVSGSDTVQKE